PMTRKGRKGNDLLPSALSRPASPPTRIERFGPPTQNPPCFFMQQFLNFLPLPQGQGSFRPTFCLASGFRGRARRGDGRTGGLTLGTSGAFLPVSFSRANRSSPCGLPSSSLTRRRCSSFSAFSVASQLSYSGNRSPVSVQVSSR